MYLGHICTLVLLPSCHPHRLSYQAFMSRRTKYLSPGHFSPCSRWHLTFMYDFVCFLGTTGTQNIRFLVMLVLSVPFYRFAPAFGFAFIRVMLLLFEILCEICVLLNSLSAVSHISPWHFMHLFETLIYESLYPPPLTVTCTGPVFPVFD